MAIWEWGGSILSGENSCNVKRSLLCSRHDKGVHVVHRKD